MRALSGPAVRSELDVPRCGLDAKNATVKDRKAFHLLFISCTSSSRTILELCKTWFSPAPFDIYSQIQLTLTWVMHATWLWAPVDLDR